MKRILSKNPFTFFMGLFFLSLSHFAVGQCTYTLSMADSWGDGWNGNTMDVLVNDVAVLSGVALDDATDADGSSGTMTFTVNDGDDVTTNWIGGGSYGSETSYNILDATGNVVGSGAQTSITTGTITASCPLCTQPTAVFTVNVNCTTGTFMVDINVTDMGDATAYDVSDGTSSVGMISGTGTTSVGPFPNDTPVDLTLIHNMDVQCNLTESGLVNALCPTIVSEAMPASGSLCYGNNASTAYAFVAEDGVSPLTITFTAGFTESTYDFLIVLDSDGVTQLYNSDGDATGVTLTSSGPVIYYGVLSDNTVSCEEASTCCSTPLAFTVEYAVEPCGPPTGIAHTLISPMRCQITWDAIPGANWYDVHYRVKGSGPTGWNRAPTMDAERTLNYLAPNTEYDYIIRASCDGTWDFATASDIRRFNTANAPVAREALFSTEILGLSPNPATDLVRLNYTASSSNVSITVTDMMGRNVYQNELNNVEGYQNETIDVSTFGKGYYIVVLQSGQDRVIQKFAVIK